MSNKMTVIKQKGEKVKGGLLAETSLTPLTSLNLGPALLLGSFW